MFSETHQHTRPLTFDQRIAHTHPDTEPRPPGHFFPSTTPTDNHADALLHTPSTTCASAPRYNNAKMVVEAILDLKERSGSSPKALTKMITLEHPDMAFSPHELRAALKLGVDSGTLIKVRGAGCKRTRGLWWRW